MAGRRFLIYFCWDRSRECDVDLGVLDERYPALFELRRAAWPHFEHAAPPEHKQGIAGFLDDVILEDFRELAATLERTTGVAPRLVERKRPDGLVPLDEKLLREVDTLLLVSLDHFRTEQRPSAGELAAVRSFLARKGSCLFASPHHDLGRTDSVAGREEELLHHGDRLVPSHQRIGGFACALLKELGLAVEPRYGLSPARTPDGSPAPLRKFPERDERGVLEGVPTFHLHGHLPHLAFVRTPDGPFRVLAEQAIQLDAPPHPFVRAGNETFQAFLWAPPALERRGDVFVCDATLWSAAFGGLPSLRRLWENVARLPLG